MTVDAGQLRSGKGSKDENFPVASRLVHPRYRAAILAFYEFVRVADDIADHTTLSEAEKLAHLDGLGATLDGRSDVNPEGIKLRAALARHRLSPQHAKDLLTAFRMDVTKHRYADWDDLIDNCAYSAMPVGRYVLDVHGESRATWPSSDALCAALQVINHLQDCADDYRNLDRVYIPLDAFKACGTSIDALRAERASPELMRCIRGLAERTAALLEQSRPLPALVRDARLSLEISVIQMLARHLVGLLQTRDPLSERVHLDKFGVAAIGFLGITKGLFTRLLRKAPAVRRA